MNVEQLRDVIKCQCNTVNQEFADLQRAFRDFRDNSTVELEQRVIKHLQFYRVSKETLKSFREELARKEWEEETLQTPKE